MKKTWNELMEESVILRILVYLGIGVLICVVIDLCDNLIPWDNIRYNLLIILIVFCTSMILRKLSMSKKK